MANIDYSIGIENARKFYRDEESLRLMDLPINPIETKRVILE